MTFDNLDRNMRVFESLGDERVLPSMGRKGLLQKSIEEKGML